jgi:hypothetical protein
MHTRRIIHTHPHIHTLTDVCTAPCMYIINAHAHSRFCMSLQKWTWNRITHTDMYVHHTYTLTHTGTHTHAQEWRHVWHTAKWKCACCLHIHVLMLSVYAYENHCAARALNAQAHTHVDDTFSCLYARFHRVVYEGEVVWSVSKR